MEKKSSKSQSDSDHVHDIGNT
jgi:hypothetical protein